MLRTDGLLRTGEGSLGSSERRRLGVIVNAIEPMKQWMRWMRRALPRKAG